MTDEIRAALTRHLPGPQHLPSDEPWSVVPLGAGLDHAAYLVDGRLVVRQSHEPDPQVRAAAVHREAELLTIVAQWSTLPVPVVAFVDEPLGLLGYPLLPGRPLLDRPEVGPVTVASALGAFLSRLHAAPIAELEQVVEADDEPLTGWLDEAREAYAAVVTRVPATQRPAVEEFLAAAPPAEPTEFVFCHNDLGAEHVLVDGETVTGVIDWSDAAIADPAHDLGRLYRDLGPAAFTVVVDRYDREVDAAMLARARFYARCALLEDLAFGLRAGDHRYSDAALRHLSATFA